MDDTPQTSSPSRAARLAGPLVALAIVGFIGWGLWQASRPVSVPLQGLVEARTFNVVSKVTARVESLAAREGDTVKAGAVLARLDSPEVRAKVEQAAAAQAAADAQSDLVQTGARQEDIRTARAMADKAEAASQLAQKTFQRINALYQDGLVPLQRKDEAETNHLAARQNANAARAQLDVALTGARPQEKQAALARARQAAGGVAEVGAAADEVLVKAPVSGEVDTVVLHVGELAPAGVPIMTVVDLSDVWAVFNVREDEFSGIAMGAELQATVPALADRQVALKIHFISPRGDYATWRATRQTSGFDIRTFEVRARPTAPVDGLRPGMTVLVER
jgi:HlyD family secretion protein